MTGESSRRGGLDSSRVDRTSRPIDLVHLARQTLGDRGLECEVFRLFEAQVTTYFQRVRASTDPYEITLGLHTLKGSSQGVGAMMLADLAKAAEAEFEHTGALDGETLDDLDMAVQEVCAFIATLIAD